jgi:sec-independent protein translocase protein TatB
MGSSHPPCPERVSFPTLGDVFNLGPGEVIVILVAGLVVLGPEKLPDMIRKAGRLYGEMRRMANGFQSELRDAFDEPMKEMRDTVNSTKQMMEDGFTEPKPFQSSIMSDEERARLAAPSEPVVDSGPNFGSAAPALTSADTGLPTLEELADGVPEPIDPSAPPMVEPVGEPPTIHVTARPNTPPPPPPPVFLPPPPTSSAGWAPPTTAPALSPLDTP